MRWLSLFALCAALSPLAAQSRQPVRGGAELPGGAPWSGATVTFLSRPIPKDERFGTAEIVRVRTDAKGRFAAQLLPGRRYTTWASERLDDGRQRVSAPAENVACARPVWLVCDGAAHHPRRIQVDGLDPWRRRGPIVVRVLSMTENIVVEPCTTDADGKFVAPPIPGRNAGLEILCGSQPILPWPRDLALRSAGDRVYSTRVKQPRDALFRVVDGSTNRPLRGARFEQATIATSWPERVLLHELGVSDDDGYVRATLPIGTTRAFGWINWAARTTCPGYQPLGALDRLNIPLDHDPAAARAADSPVFTIKLPPTKAATGTILANGKPFRGALRARGRLRGASSGSGSMLTRETWSVEPDADGKFRFDMVPGYPVLLTACPDPEDLARYAGKKHPVHPVAVLAAMPSRPVDVEIGTIDLAKLRAVDVSVLEADGTPASDARIGVGDPGASGAHAFLDAIPTDRLGRARILLASPSELVVVAWSKRGAHAVRLEKRGVTDGHVTVRLAAAKSGSGTLRDRKGAVVGGARVVFSVDAKETPLQTLAASIPGLSAVTDKEGRFEIPLYAGLRYSLRRVTVGGDTSWPKYGDFTVGRDEPASIEISLGR